MSDYYELDDQPSEEKRFTQLETVLNLRSNWKLTTGHSRTSENLPARMSKPVFEISEQTCARRP